MTSRRTRITFHGLNLNRTVNSLSQKYLVWDVSRSGKRCQITVETACAEQVVAYLREKCYNVTDVQVLGGSFALSFLQKHFLLPLFVVLAIAVVALSANFCWKIEVVGDFSQQEVLQALSQCDVGVGTPLFRFSADRLENQLAVQLDAMYAVVNRRGSTLYVNAVKRKTVSAPIDMHKRRDIVATVSGKVTYLLCEQGTATVSVGDTVKKGDVLIAGLRTFNDGTVTSVYALGRVVVEQSCAAFEKFTGTAARTVETGNVCTQNNVVLFGKSYGRQPPFESYRTEQTQTSLFPLNLTVQHVTYYETTQVIQPVTLEECLEQLKTAAMQQASAKANFEIKYTQYSVSEQGVTATVYGETEIF